MDFVRGWLVSCCLFGSGFLIAVVCGLLFPIVLGGSCPVLNALVQFRGWTSLCIVVVEFWLARLMFCFCGVFQWVICPACNACDFMP